jgi:hypothetical protein
MNPPRIQVPLIEIAVTEMTMKKIYLITVALLSTIPSSSQTASTFISQALNVLAPTGIVAQDVQLDGNLEYIAGSQDEKGTVVLLSNEQGMTRTELLLQSESLLETKRTVPAARGGESKAARAATSPIGIDNLLTCPAWFFPEHLLKSLSENGRSAKLVKGDTPTVDGTVHIRSWLSVGPPGSPHSAHVGRLSSMDYYIDQTSFTLNEVDFSTHPETNASVSLPIRILFSDYRPIDGHLIPFHLKKYVSGTLNADITITSATVNPNMSPSNYTLQ